MSLEKMNDKMMREYLRDHRIDIGKPEYEEGSLFGKFTLFFRDETFNFRDSHSLSDLYENCIVSAAYSGTGPHYAITCVHGSRSNYDGMYSQMEEAQKLFLSVFRVDQRQYYQNQSMPENSFISFIFVILDGGIIPLQYLYRYIIRINSSIQKGPPGFPESPLHSFTLLKEYGEGVDRMCRELESIGLPDPAYTHLYRKWGRLDDRLYFSMIIVNVVMAVADGLAYFLEGRDLPMVREVIIAANAVFFGAFALFAYLMMLYLHYRVYGDRERFRTVSNLGDKQ